MINSIPIAIAGLAITNLTTLVLYLLGWVGIGELLWSYWLQSVIIGIFNAVRMGLLQRFSTDGFTSNGKQIPATASGKLSTIGFFLVHFGIFHVVYAVFLLAFSQNFFEITFESQTLLWILLFILGFALSEFLALLNQITIDRQGVPNIGSLMFWPYLRIIPMHLCILCGSFIGLAIILFIILKAVTDGIGVYADDRINQKTAAAAGNSNHPDARATKELSGRND